MKHLSLFTFLLIFSVSLSAQTKISSQVAAQQQPSFAALTMDGTKIDTAVLKGKIVVLNLWFINCPNCVEEIKLLNNVVNQYINNKDVVFIAPAASSKVELEKFLVKHPFNYQVIPNAGALILSKFGTPDKNGEISMPFPMHYVLDRSGGIVVKVQGTKGVEAVKAELAKQFAPKNTVVK